MDRGYPSVSPPGRVLGDDCGGELPARCLHCDWVRYCWALELIRGWLFWDIWVSDDGRFSIWSDY